MAACDMKLQMFGIVFDTCRIKFKIFHFIYITMLIEMKLHQRLKLNNEVHLISEKYFCNNDI